MSDTPSATALLARQTQHLASLLEAVQRCVYFLEAADHSVSWPLLADTLEEHKKDAALFGSLAAINERFAKLQDTLGGAMRHAMDLSSEPAETFLNVLVFYEKVGVIQSTTDWQTCRSARNLAAHSYETDYLLIAEHFNGLHAMRLQLYRTADEFLKYCQTRLRVEPANRDFTPEFAAIVGTGST
jgi:hypothetical protein